MISHNIADIALDGFNLAVETRQNGNRLRPFFFDLSEEIRHTNPFRPKKMSGSTKLSLNFLKAPFVICVAYQIQALVTA